ncbi:DUF917 domain-containing protein [Streptomyces longispororuber]|uniref:DUF917 domain-containing protein n=1 Tax=Streptomyces longispororuber TaxID=68230 RepID=UPI00210BB184|nr:DUF917 domain-containing protein [Streptomyces longispororuber]MCQ4210161.1 DUF917 domain-containing protein [Streptomyces longispororuber]
MHLDAQALTDFARGCAVLGSGGGGPVADTLPVAAQAIEECGPVPVVAPEELPTDALVLPVSLVGSPAVAAERIGGRGEAGRLAARVEQLHGRPVAAVMCGEIGGQNGCFTVSWAARLGVPLLDADSIGRAFPRLDQNVLELAGLSPFPAVLSDEYGRTVVLDDVDGAFLEELARPVVAVFGGRAVSADYPLSAGQAARHAVRGSVTTALALGRGEDLDPVLTGKVASVQRPGDGAASVLLEGTGGDAGRLVVLRARSEFVAAMEDGRALALVPDVIALIDARTGWAVPVEEVRYGLRVRLVTFPSAAVWYTEAGLRLAGPEAFGLAGLKREVAP